MLKLREEEGVGLFTCSAGSPTFDENVGRSRTVTPLPVILRFLGQFDGCIRFSIKRGLHCSIMYRFSCRDDTTHVIIMQYSCCVIVVTWRLIQSPATLRDVLVTAVEAAVIVVTWRLIQSPATLRDVLVTTVEAAVIVVTWRLIQSPVTLRDILVTAAMTPLAASDLIIAH